ncbi:MAG: N-acetyltransferase [Mesorhizobium sp.]
MTDQPDKSNPYIRHMKASDAQSVSALMQASWERTFGPLMGLERASAETRARHNPAHIEADLKRPHSESFVAETVDGEIVGYAFATVIKGKLWLERLHVLPVSQGGGTAASLMHAVIINYLGERSIRLEVFRDNHRAVRFYEREGFSVAEERGPDKGFAGLPSLIMIKPMPLA